MARVCEGCSRNEDVIKLPFSRGIMNCDDGSLSPPVLSSVSKGGMGSI